VSDRSTHPQRRSTGGVRPRYLSDDVRQHVAIGTMRSVSRASLPLARAPEPPPATQPTSADPASVQAQRDEGEAGGEDQGAERPGGSTGARPSPQQVANRVYQLLRQDLRIERERVGW
jgi:hypothetical protein